MLLAFRASLPDLKGKDLPSRLLVAKWGRNDNTKGATILVNETTARLLPTVNRVLGFNTVALDFEHETVEGSDAYKASREPRKVAGHGTPRVIPGEGLFVENIRWTPEGEASARGGHHPDLSPAVKTNDAGEVVLLHSAALCRQGSIDDLHVFAAGLDAASLQLFSATLAPISQPASHMNERQILLKLLGLPETATAEQIATATSTFTAALTAAAGVATQITALNSTLKTQGETLTSLQTKLDEAERRSITAEALGQGKLITASVGELPLEQFRKVVGELPAGVVPLHKRTPELVKTFSAGLPQGGEDTAALMRQAADINQEDWDKHAKR